jgi:hypothetical protein
MSAVVSGSAPRAIGRTARLAFPLLIEFPDGISNPKRTRPNAQKGLWESRIVSEKLVNPLSRHTKKLSIPSGQLPAMPTIGLLRGVPPIEPSKGAPKLKMPPSEATSQ